MKLPLVVILGATASGKTKLSIEIAKTFGGQIISADSMQIYKGLDIISAKATEDEQNCVKHHLLDEFQPTELCTVLDYRNKTLPVIDNLLKQGILPVLVGGTNYYVESILWKILVPNPNEGSLDASGLMQLNDEIKISTPVLHEKLRIVDPEMAQRLHPNNRRKILRSLEVLEQRGKKLSDILKQQQLSMGGNSFGGGLRYPNTIIFWLQCEQNILNERINKRVDQMFDNGLLNELTTFHKTYNEERLINGDIDYTKGIFQAIGFKEFDEYLRLSDEERRSDHGKKLLDKGLEELKMVTRRYAKKQCKWISNRFLGRSDRKVPPIYGLKTDDPTKWHENVLNPALSQLNWYLEQNISDHDTVKSPPLKPLEPIPVLSTPNSQDKTYFCEGCQRVFVGNFQWSLHVKSKRHKRTCASRERRLEREKSKTTI